MSVGALLPYLLPRFRLPNLRLPDFLPSPPIRFFSLIHQSSVSLSSVRHVRRSLWLHPPCTPRLPPVSRVSQGSLIIAKLPATCLRSHFSHAPSLADASPYNNSLCSHYLVSFALRHNLIAYRNWAATLPGPRCHAPRLPPDSYCVCPIVSLATRRSKSPL